MMVVSERAVSAFLLNLTAALGLNGHVKYGDEQPRDESGRWSEGGSSGGGTGDSGGEGESGEGAGRAARAQRTHKPSTAAKQRRGEAEQRRIAKQLGGIETADNEAFDVILHTHAIEVKTIIDNDNDKITVHPESRRRKEKQARARKLAIHTVVVDVRAGSRAYYYRAGVGAFRLSAMERVTLAGLREKLAGKAG